MKERERGVFGYESGVCGACGVFMFYFPHAGCQSITGRESTLNSSQTRVSIAEYTESNYNTPHRPGWDNLSLTTPISFFLRTFSDDYFGHFISSADVMPCIWELDSRIYCTVHDSLNSLCYQM